MSSYETLCPRSAIGGNVVECDIMQRDDRAASFDLYLAAGKCPGYLKVHMGKCSTPGVLQMRCEVYTVAVINAVTMCTGEV